MSAANDYVTRTWSCTIGGTPCSALGDAYSGTYFSNDGGETWCCTSTDPPHIGTLIPGVDHLVGGPYDAGGDPAVAFDSHGVGYDGTLYVIFEGDTRLSTLDGQWIVKSTDGGVTWTKPTKIADVQDVISPANTAYPG